MKIYNLIEAGKKIRENLLIVENQGGTYYFDLVLNEDTDDEEIIKIRVSDHSARVANNNGNRTFSFITDWNQQDSNMKNEWVVDFNGEMEEEFQDVDELLEFELN